MRKLGQMSSDASPNVTPLVDVFLILMVTLMLAMPSYVHDLGVELPKVQLTSTPVVVNALLVSVHADGSVWLGKKASSLVEVMAKVTSKTDVQLAVDQKVPYSVLARVVAGLQSRSPQSISLLVG